MQPMKLDILTSGSTDSTCTGTHAHPIEYCEIEPEAEISEVAAVGATEVCPPSPVPVPPSAPVPPPTTVPVPNLAPVLALALAPVRAPASAPTLEPTLESDEGVITEDHDILCLYVQGRA